MYNRESLSEFFDEYESCDDIFSILEALDQGENNRGDKTVVFAGSKDIVGDASNESFEFQKSVHKRQKLIDSNNVVGVSTPSASQMEDGHLRVSHITVQRNRRKQMNEHLTVLRTLMPSFYVKRGDQATIIGGVINYINELQQFLQALEAKKQRKAYTKVLSPRPLLNSRPNNLLSPRKPPFSPRQPHNLQMGFLNSPAELSPCNSSSSSIHDSVNELVASSKSAVAEVEVKFCGSNLVLKTASRRVSGQVAKIVSTLEELDLEILQVNINIVDHERMLNSFTIKIGIECQLSAEDLAHRIQLTFC